MLLSLGIHGESFGTVTVKDWAYQCGDDDFKLYLAINNFGSANPQLDLFQSSVLVTKTGASTVSYSTAKVVDSGFQTAQLLPVDFNALPIDARKGTEPDANIWRWVELTLPVLENGEEYTFFAIDRISGSGWVTIVECGDDTPPEIACSLEIESLWVPNHELIDVGLQVDASDDSGLDPTVEVFVFRIARRLI
ncbi:MAG: hypothetical protein O3A00_26540 [Planctomycetota bacterium]|nr:hypothetical protein [Planctomycetota bacterium]